MLPLSCNLYLDMALRQFRSMDMTCWVMLQLWEPADLRGEVQLLPLPLGFFIGFFLPPAFVNRPDIYQEGNYQCFCWTTMSSVAGEQVRGRGRGRRRVAALLWASCQTGLFRCLGLQHNPTDTFSKKGGTKTWRNKASKALSAISGPSVSRLLLVCIGTLALEGVNSCQSANTYFPPWEEGAGPRRCENVVLRPDWEERTEQAHTSCEDMLPAALKGRSTCV